MLEKPEMKRDQYCRGVTIFRSDFSFILTHQLASYGVKKKNNPTLSVKQVQLIANPLSECLCGHFILYTAFAMGFFAFILLLPFIIQKTAAQDRGYMLSSTFGSRMVRDQRSTRSRDAPRAHDPHDRSCRSREEPSSHDELL